MMMSQIILYTLCGICIGVSGYFIVKILSGGNDGL